MSNYNVDSTKVLDIASRIEQVNNDLESTLESSKNKVRSLDSVWEGKAADSVILEFCSFIDKYSAVYYDMVNGFVKYLRNSVAAGAVAAEQANMGS